MIYFLEIASSLKRSNSAPLDFLNVTNNSFFHFKMASRRSRPTSFCSNCNLSFEFSNDVCPSDCPYNHRVHRECAGTLLRDWHICTDCVRLYTEFAIHGSTVVVNPTDDSYSENTTEIDSDIPTVDEWARPTVDDADILTVDELARTFVDNWAATIVNNWALLAVIKWARATAYSWGRINLFLNWVWITSIPRTIPLFHRFEELRAKLILISFFSDIGFIFPFLIFTYFVMGQYGVLFVVSDNITVISDSIRVKKILHMVYPLFILYRLFHTVSSWFV